MLSFHCFQYFHNAVCCIQFQSRVGQFRLVKTQYDNEYQIVTNGDIDRETTDRYRLTVYCKDGGRPPLNSSSDVVINIVDVNDNSPRFTQHIYTSAYRKTTDPSRSATDP